MTNQDDEDASRANPRRGERRAPQIIEGVAQESQLDPPAEAPPSAAGTLEQDAPQSAEEAPYVAGSTQEAAPAASRNPATIFALIALSLSILALGGAAALTWRDFYARGAAQAELRSQVAALQGRLAAVAAAQKSSAAALTKERDHAAAAMQTAQAASKSANQALAAARSASSAASSSEIADLRKQVAALAARPDPAALKSALADAQGKLDALGKKVQSLDSDMSAQAQRIAPLQTLLNAPKLDVPAIEASNAEAVAEARSAALVVVARALEKGVDSGSPYEAQVVAARRLGADPKQLNALEASATDGAPTAAVLRQKFEPLAGPILAGVDRKHATTILGRLTSGLGRLVSVRTIGQAASGDSAALVGQIEGALARGDVAAALAARDKLSSKGKGVTKAWAAQARARLAAQQNARAVLRAAIERLGKARS